MGLRAIEAITLKKILITDFDMNRLYAVIDSVNEESLIGTTELDEKLLSADVIEAKEAPADLVTMNSRIICSTADTPTARPRRKSLTLVYPQNADIVANRISILSPVGGALLGSRIGETLTWKGNDGVERKMKLEGIEYQPELYGDWHL